MSTQHQYWDAFYAGRVSQDVPTEPSSFACWVEERVPEGHVIAEIGFGNARDSLWFAAQGRTVVGYDFAESAVSQARTEAAQGSLPAGFGVLDLYDRRAALRVGKALATSGAPVVIYGRFLVHALERPGRENLFDLAAEGLPERGGSLFLEFRTGLDAATPHVFGEDHFRVFLNPTRVAEELEERGATITHAVSGHGMAVFRDEDPHVARLVAEWPRRRQSAQ